jgi:hypothetical protein
MKVPSFLWQTGCRPDRFTTPFPPKEAAVSFMPVSKPSRKRSFTGHFFFAISLAVFKQ